MGSERYARVTITGVALVIGLVLVPAAIARVDAGPEAGAAQIAPPPPGDGEVLSCQPGTFTNAVAPVVSPGSGYVGDTFSTSNGTWSACTVPIQYFIYQWMLNGGSIGGANGSSYTAGAAGSLTSRVAACNDDVGCSAWAYSSNSAAVSTPPPPPPPNYPPAVPVEEAFPADGQWTSSASGPLRVKYSDPEGATGSLTYEVYSAGGTLVDAITRSGVVSGDFPNQWLNANLQPGDYVWRARAHDGAQYSAWSSDVYGWYGFHVNYAPATPTHDLPVAAGDVPSISPVLSANGTDADGDTLAYRFRVSTVNPTTACPSVALDSDFLWNTRTYAVPSGSLRDGCSYSWTVQTSDMIVRDDGTTNQSAVSGSRALNVRLPKLGLRDYWPVWSRGGVAVNQATGNLMLAVPGPEFPTAAGSLSASLTYNSLDTRPSAFAGSPGWTLAAGDDPPARLVDHSQSGVADRFEAVERVSADGSSDYYTRIGTSNTYQSPAGDLSVLERTAAGGFLLTDADGSIYEFAAPTSDGNAALTRAEVVSAKKAAARLEFAYSGGRVQTVTSWGKDAAQTDRQLGKLTFNWSCTGALLCIEGPNNAGDAANRTWKYVGSGGASGQLVQVHNGTRTMLQLSYGANGKPATLKNANDLDPNAAGPGYTGSTGNPGVHELQLAYDGSGRLITVTETDVRDRYLSPSRPDAIWSFAYYAGACPGTTLQAPAAHSAGSQPALNGCTELAPPRLQGTTKRLRVFYDNLAHPLEQVDVAGNYTLTAYNHRDQLDWAEDELGNPTDYAYDSFDFSLTSVTGPDPDGAGPLNRSLTGYRYDETKIGDATTPGPALTGLKAAYFANANLSGRPEAYRTDANVDFNWGTGAPTALPSVPDNFSVRWTGVLEVAATGSYYLATVADDGSRVTVGNQLAVDGWAGQSASTPLCSTALTLTAGRHRIVVEYRELTGSASVQLRLGPTCAGATAVAGSSLKPGYLNQTSVVAPPNASGAAARVSFSHFAEPWEGLADYALVKVGTVEHVTSFEYDDFGRIVRKTMPRGNVGRLQADGSLGAATVDGPKFSTVWSYYAAGATASWPAACTLMPAPAVGDQRGLLRSVKSGEAAPDTAVAPVVSVYDLHGRPVAVTNGKGTSCSRYDAEGRLVEEKAPGETSSIVYAYDPAGQARTVTQGSQTVAHVYAENGALLHTTDSFGAELELVQDLEGNALKRRLATGPLGTSTVYETAFVYDDDNQLTQLTDPGSRLWKFFYDERGTLRATQHPNGTFSWKDINAAGWLTNLYNRHGSISAWPTTLPADASPIVDFAYGYVQSGQRSSETRSGGGLTTETTSYGYDAIGRLETVTLPTGAARRYCFDLDSNRSAIYSAGSGAAPACGSSGADTSYIYDPAASPGVDQLTSVNEAGQLRSFAYDADGNMTQRGADTLSWDGRGRLSGGTTRGTEIAYGFDPVGFRRQRTGTLRYGGEVIQHAPLLYWRLADAAGSAFAEDSSGSVLPGAFSGGVTLGQAGPVSTETNPAAGFDGVDDQVSRTVALTSTANLTLEAWAYWNGTAGNRILLYNGTPGTNGYGFAVSNGACGAGSNVYLLLGGVSCGAVNGGVMPVNQWVHLAAARTSGGTWTLYVNGVSKGTSTLTPVTPTGSTSISPAGFRFNGRVDEVALYARSLGASLITAHYQRATTTVSSTTRYLLGGLIETDAAGTITGFPVAGPEGDLTRYAGPPSTALVPNFLYYNGHGDLAAQANGSGTRLAAYTYDAFGAASQASLPGNATAERFTGRWDKQLDTASGLIEMGVRPYDPVLGRFLAVDPIEGGSLNAYDYAGQDPINGYDLDGRVCFSLSCAKKAVSKTTKTLRRAGKWSAQHADLIVAAAAVSCVLITGGACAPLAVAALVTTVSTSAYRNGIVGGRPRNIGRFAADVAIGASFFGVGKLASRAVNPFYVRSASDRGILTRVTESLLFLTDQMAQQARYRSGR